MAGEEGEGGEEAVDDEENRGEWVNADVEVSETLEEFQLSGGEKGVVS